MPIDCEPQRTCFVQQYVDIDPTPGARDFRCGTATYDGHKGTDFRVLSTTAAEQGVRVLAAADGIVRGVRDGMADQLVRDRTNGDVDGRECGNGVLIEHGDGWETQYCHMRRGSIAVAKGDTVRRGQPLGDVGYSGLAQFAHLHLSVRHRGKVIDPFTGLTPGEACMAGADGASGLWDETAGRGFAYADGLILGLGFTGAPPDVDRLEIDHRLAAPTPTSPALVLYARSANLKAGDRLRLTLAGPGGLKVDTPGEPMARTKATFTAFLGKKLRAARWPAGRYEGLAEVVREGTVVSSQKAELVLE